MTRIALALILLAGSTHAPQQRGRHLRPHRPPPHRLRRSSPRQYHQRRLGSRPRPKRLDQISRPRRRHLRHPRPPLFDFRRRPSRWRWRQKRRDLGFRPRTGRMELAATQQVRAAKPQTQYPLRHRRYLRSNGQSSGHLRRLYRRGPLRRHLGLRTNHGDLGSTGPIARNGAVGVYLAHESRALFFGGVGTEVRLNDVWALEGLAPAPPPTAVEAASWGTVKTERKNTPRNIPAND